MSPDSAFLYGSAQHSAALTMLEFALESLAPFCLLTGEIGSGKTTLIRRLLRMVSGQPITVGLVSHSHGRFRSIHPWALSALGIVDDDESEIGQFEALNDFFIREYGRGRRTVLIFDEAQNLSVRTLEELRLLSNVNSEKDVALQIILVGQPELRRKLQRPELKQFAQRVSIEFHLNALALPEAEAYVRHRLTVAGGSDAIFDRQSIELIHEHSGGIPRLINQLCDLSLVYAYAEGRHQVSASIVAEVLRDKGRGYSVQPAAPAAVPATNGASAPRMTTTMAPAALTIVPPMNGAAAPRMTTAMAPPAGLTPVPATNGATAPRLLTAVAVPTDATVADAIVADETQDTVIRPAKIGRLPLTIGTPQRKVSALPLNIGVQPVKDSVQPETESAQPKKRSSKTHRSWFFFFLKCLVACSGALLISHSRAEGLIAARLGVIYNLDDASSRQVALEYAGLRAVPSENVIGIHIPLVNVMLPAEFEPIRARLIEELPTSVQSLLLVWSKPYAVGCMSITTAFAAGYRPAFCVPGCARTSPSPLFDSDGWLPADTVDWFPAMLLPSDDENLARDLIQRGIAADSSAPPGTLYLIRTTDAPRNVRAATYADTTLLLESRVRVAQWSAPISGEVPEAIGYFTGAAWVEELPHIQFRPGALADHLTSTGGVLEGGRQMSAVAWLKQGATASYGSVSEPCSYPEKFPNVSVLFEHYMHGETALEAYWKSVAMPGQGLIVGEPLARPFASRP